MGEFDWFSDYDYINSIYWLARGIHYVSPEALDFLIANITCVTGALILNNNYIEKLSKSFLIIHIIIFLLTFIWFCLIKNDIILYQYLLDIIYSWSGHFIKVLSAPPIISIFFCFSKDMGPKKKIERVIYHTILSIGIFSLIVMP